MLPNHIGKELKLVHRLLPVPLPVLRSVCLLPDAQVEKTPYVLWHMVPDPTTLTETLLFMGECQSLVVKKRKKGGMSYVAIMLMSKSSFS